MRFVQHIATVQDQLARIEREEASCARYCEQRMAELAKAREKLRGESAS